MSTNRMQPTDAGVQEHIAAKATGPQHADCQALLALLGSVTGEQPRMWGAGIIGFGAYRYTYQSGRTGEAPLAAFAIRGRELVVYLDCESGPQRELLARLGPHKVGKSCLYFKRLADLDLAVLETLVRNAIAEVRRRHG